MLLISDANILIDMAEGGVLEPMFRLPDTFAAPDVLFAEELSDRHPELPDLGLQLITLHGDGIIEAFRLKQLVTGRDAPSQNDLFALALARQENCPLLTGDRRLRTVTTEHHPEIEVRGTLWLMERMKGSRLITAWDAALAYGRMKRSGSRLPWPEVERQLRVWGVTMANPRESRTG